MAETDKGLQNDRGASKERVGRYLDSLRAMLGLVAGLRIQVDLSFDVNLNGQKVDLYMNMFKRWIHVVCW